MLQRCVTRIYFADEPTMARDPILRLVPTERRDTLIAQPETEDGRTLYRWNIVLQGAGETVLFNL